MASAEGREPCLASQSRLSAKEVQSYFFLFGVAVLLPWNFMLSSMEFMNIMVFPTYHWTLTVTPLYTGIGLATNVLLLLVGDSCTTWKLLLPTLLFGVGFAVLPLLSLFKFWEDDVRFFVAMLAIAGLSFCAAGILQSQSGMLAAKLMREHGPLPAHLSNGIAASGLISVVVSVSVTAAAGQGAATKVLFVLLALVLASCLLALCRLWRAGLLAEIDVANAEALQTAENQAFPSIDTVNISMQQPEDRPSEQSPAQARSRPFTSPLFAVSPRFRQTVLTRRRSSMMSPRIERIGSGIHSAKRQECNLLICYVQTFLVFPSVALLWEPQGNPPFVDQATYGLIMASIFQVFDLLGRLMCSGDRALQICPGGKIWIVAMLRFLLLPLFVFCWRMPHGVFGLSVLQSLLMAAFGTSNGVLTNLAFMAGSAAARESERDVVGRALLLCISLGIVIGSVLSSGIIQFFDSVK
eukprot:gnl/TRDRNA2_/TRDRNA2_135315_c0_seq1.p1 gnl/TRDRNA2_/TRDRNA2_135315_c0~~gnl/TRDRNA2_/TRDRNA2_135315_c0_seq1.p1  ORF type:complete len:467 (+),score=51.46 gnl/TRDRNA2_/TRDRNA2_135315_c0_seq1:11-1411(+)